MPIRWRLTLWFALILCAILLLSGIVLNVLLQRYLINEVDGNLRVYSARVHGTLDPQAMNDTLDYDVIHAMLPPINEFATPGIYIQIIDRNGNIIAKSDSLGDQQLPVNPALIQKGFEGTAAIENVSAGGRAGVRIMVSPLYLKDQTVLLEIGQSLSHIDSTLTQVRWALLSSIVLALMLAVVSGGFLVRSALTPVSQITGTARSIIKGGLDAGRRVDYRGPPDEIGQLASTFDLMIDNLDQAFQSQKHFVADSSHELRGPLTVIRGNLDLLKRGTLSEADRKESLKAIESETARMIKIANDLLLLAEIESQKAPGKETVSLKSIVLEELKRARLLAGKRQVSVGRLESLSITGDTLRLKQVLANLVENAIKYTPETGSIILSLFREGDWARLEVADTGMGIAPEHLPHIFDRFYRVDKARSRATGGAGLGLAIVKGIVEQHAGHVTVTSEPGTGTTFTVWLKL